MISELQRDLRRICEFCERDIAGHDDQSSHCHSCTAKFCLFDMLRTTVCGWAEPRNLKGIQQRRRMVSGGLVMGDMVCECLCSDEFISVSAVTIFCIPRETIIQCPLQ